MLLFKWDSNLSTKGIKWSAQRDLVHQSFRDTIFSGKTMRVYNYDIVLKVHLNLTVKQNKLGLSPFDLKRVLFSTAFQQLPLDIRPPKKKIFLEDIHMNTEWADSYKKADNTSPEYQIPYWRFLPRPYSETELLEEEASSSRICERPTTEKPLCFTGSFRKTI